MGTSGETRAWMEKCKVSGQGLWTGLMEGTCSKEGRKINSQNTL